MNLLTSTTLALALLSGLGACSKESKKEPESPSQLMPASGTEGTQDMERSPPGMSPAESEGQEMTPPSEGPTSPGTQVPGSEPGAPDAGMQHEGLHTGPGGGNGGNGGGGMGGRGGASFR